MTATRPVLKAGDRVVVKLGSALLTNEGCGLKEDTLSVWVSQILELRKRGIAAVLVSSGAVAEGVSRLGWRRRPHALHELQAAAAVGQMGMIQAYELCFQKDGVRTAQILLTHDDIRDRRRYLNARTTLRTLVGLGVVPIVNENDSVATEEIRFGDNDSLAGLVTNLVEADLLVILTDQPGLFDRDPRLGAGATLISSARAGDRALERYAGEGGSFGRGGMLTKLRAAATAAKSGAHTVIAGGLEKNVLARIAAGEPVGTMLTADQVPIAARKQWLAGLSRVNGSLSLDDGAVGVLRGQGKSLLAVGVTSVSGNFRRGEIVSCLDARGTEVARGLVNYNADEIRKIRGQPSERIEALLGYVDEPELIHRDNLILL
ncbi:MAG: glutamate 5-kinase [Gammaproteobacteria bacterium]|nr:glutamate 5-kinase [Gammaproteobacteria bacterium]